MNQAKNTIRLPLTGKWEKILSEYLEENHPQMFKELLDSGELVDFVQQREEQFINQMRHLYKQGLAPDQAQELAWEAFIAVPSEPERS